MTVLGTLSIIKGKAKYPSLKINLNEETTKYIESCVYQLDTSHIYRKYDIYIKNSWDKNKLTIIPCFKELNNSANSCVKLSYITKQNGDKLKTTSFKIPINKIPFKLPKFKATRLEGNLIKSGAVTMPLTEESIKVVNENKVCNFDVVKNSPNVIKDFDDSNSFEDFINKKDLNFDFNKELRNNNINMMENIREEFRELVKRYSLKSNKTIKNSTTVEYEDVIITDTIKVKPNKKFKNDQ